MRDAIYKWLQKMFTVFLLITFVLGAFLFITQFIALITLNGKMAASIYGIVKNPMCICASFTAICGALRPYVKNKKELKHE